MRATGDDGLAFLVLPLMGIGRHLGSFWPTFRSSMAEDHVSSPSNAALDGRARKVRDR